MKIPRSPGNDNKIPGKKNRKPLKVLKFFFKICNTITFIIIKLNINLNGKIIIKTLFNLMKHF